jgi:AraC-like DNA-binding protein
MQPVPLQADLSAMFNVALTSGSITLFLLIGILAFRDLRHVIQGRLLILLCVSAIGLAAKLAPFAESLPANWISLLSALGLPNLGLIWWFCLSLLKDDFKIGAIEQAGFVALMCIPTLYFCSDLGFEVPLVDEVGKFGEFPAIVMIVHVAWYALSERGSDLVESRRRARLCLALAPLVGLIVALVSENVESDQFASMLRTGLGIIPVQLILFFWLARLSPEHVQFNQEKVAIPKPLDIDVKYIGLHQRLLAAMDVEQVYLNHGLTIDDLARKLKVPAHQLRYLINSNMGFRNFATFLNGYRLEYAKAALANVERPRDGIVNIAFEAGFASLPTFNRVFKESMGQTPSDYRETALSSDPQN